MVVESVQVGEEVLEGATQELQGLGIARLLAPEEELLAKHLQKGCGVQTQYFRGRCNESVCICVIVHMVDLE